MIVVLPLLLLLDFVQATLYVIRPSAGSTCHGGQKCIVEWLDDGEQPLLPNIGVSTVGLYTGNQQLVQTLSPVDVSRSLSLYFIPSPRAGPNSGTYYIAFSSLDLQINGSNYLSFSPFFRLDNMSGSFNSPLPSATSTIPIPPSLTRPLSQTATTITAGNLTTAATSTTTPRTSSRFQTSSSLSPSTTSPSGTAAQPSATSAPAGSGCRPMRTSFSSLAFIVFLLGFGLS